MKKCIKCEIEKPLSEFSFRNKDKGELQAHCKECKKEIDKQDYNRPGRKDSIRRAYKRSRERLKAYADSYKQRNPCTKCGETRYYVLDFHHIADKKYSISDSFKKGISVETLKKEIEKCVILCANCHRELHHFEKIEV